MTYPIDPTNPTRYAKKVILYAQLPDGETATRKTDHVYKFVSVVHSSNKAGQPATWGVLSWHETRKSAEVKISQWRKWFPSDKWAIITVLENEPAPLTDIEPTPEPTPNGSEPTTPAVNLPTEVVTALESGSPVVLSVSGGKDSEAMSKAVLSYLATRNLTNPVYMVHADLGRMEWAETPEYIRTMGTRYNVPMSIVARDHDLLEGIERRVEKLVGQNKPGFPSAAARYCTAGWKRTVINSWLGHTFNRDTTVIQCIGLRRDESRARSKTPDYCLNELASAPTLGRKVLNWYPIASWSTADVWNSLGITPEQLAETQAAVAAGSQSALISWPYHPAYAYGNSRLSCALCVLADETDLSNGAEHNPVLFRALVDIELETGFAFQKGKPLYELAPHLLTDEQRSRLPA